MLDKVNQNMHNIVSLVDEHWKRLHEYAIFTDEI